MPPMVWAAETPQRLLLRAGHLTVAFYLILKLKVMKTNRTAVTQTAPTLFGRNESPLVSLQNGVAMTSSLQVAQKFDKQHKDVLKIINNLECTPDFQKRNFALKFYIREIGNGAIRKYPLYYMTRDGFTFLVMGFTGKVAAQFKEEYINAFNQMEQYITAEATKGCCDLRAFFDKANKDLKRHISNLSKEHNLRNMSSDIPNGIAFREDLSIEENLKRIIPRMQCALADAWYILSQNAKLEKEIGGLRNTMKEIVGKAYYQHGILP